jgi:hypothetical protein
VLLNWYVHPPLAILVALAYGRFVCGVETEVIASEQVRLSTTATCGRTCVAQFLQQDEYKLCYRPSSPRLTSCTI